MATGGGTTEAIMTHLPILQVMVPFIAAPICVLLGNRKLVWGITFLASAAALAISWLLLVSVLDGSVISYHLGGWAPPLGIEYRVDAANAFVLFIVSAISTVVLLYARQSVASEIAPRHQVLFYACYLLCLTGLLGVAVTGDAFNVFVFLEISSLSTYVLVAMGAARHRRALTAAYDYLIMGTIGATFFVIGIGLLYMVTGTLNMVDLADRIADQGDSRTVRAAFAFIVVGIGLKLAIYPLHLWLPNAYTFAPSAVTSFLAATATKVAVYVMLRFMFSVFQPGFVFETLTLEFIILPFAVIAMFAASFVAIFQYDVKRLLAYSSIAQIGYMLLGISLLTATGLTASIIHIFNHAITKGALFMGLGAIVMYTGGSFFTHLSGMGKRMPWTSAAMVISGLSLIGVPGTAGFISKWILVEASLEKGWWVIALLIVASSLLAVVYVWRIVETLYLRPAPEGSVATDPPASMQAAIWIMTLACIYFGFDAQLTTLSAETAANGLLKIVGAAR